MFEWIKTFVVVYQTLNFSVAAKQLSVSQPTVSLHIKNLEDQIQASLFSRKGKQEMRPTPAADFLYPKMLQLLNDLDESFGEVSGQKELRQNVIIGSSHNTTKYLLTQVVSDLISRYTDFNFSFREMNSHDVMKKLQQNQITIGLVEMPISLENVKKELVFTDQLLIAGNLGAKYWILREKDSGMRFFNDIYLSETDTKSTIIETNSDEITKNLILNGTGRAIISSLAKSEYLDQVELTEYRQERNMYLAKNVNENNPEILQMLQWLKFAISSIQS